MALTKVTGNVVDFSSTGIHLGGTGDANHLDDYEEGSFTGTLVNTGTSPAPTATGYYIKIGKRVFFNIYFNGITIAANGNTQINGLPFSADSGRLYGTCLYTHATIIDPSTGHGHAYVSSTSMFCLDGTGFARWVVGSGKSGMWSGHYDAS